MSDTNPTIITTGEFLFSGDETARIYREARVRWIDYIFVIIGLFAVLIIAFAVNSNPEEGTLGSFWWFRASCGIPLLVYAVYPFARMRLLKRSADKLAQTENALTVRYAFDGEHIIIYSGESPIAHERLANFRYCVLSHDLLYLYVEKYNFLAIPVRAFQSEADAEQVLAMIRANGLDIRSAHPKTVWPTPRWA